MKEGPRTNVIVLRRSGDAGLRTTYKHHNIILVEYTQLQDTYESFRQLAMVG